MHGLIDTFIGYSIVILQVFAVVVLLCTLCEKYFPNPLPNIIRKNSICIGFILSLCAVLGSLYYSEIRDLAPCLFCWWQRVFIYPQVILFGVALYTREIRTAHIASIILSIIGMCIAIMHVLAQAGIRSSGLPCAATGVSCTNIDLILLGYITIPLMSLTLYLLMTIVQIRGLRNNTK